MLDVDSNPRVALAQDVLLRSEEEFERYYAFNTKNGEHFRLNHTAYWALQHTCGGILFEELLAIFQEHNDLHKDIAKKDLDDLLNDALNACIIEEVES